MGGRFEEYYDNCLENGKKISNNYNYLMIKNKC